MLGRLGGASDTQIIIPPGKYVSKRDEYQKLVAYIPIIFVHHIKTSKTYNNNEEETYEKLRVQHSARVECIHELGLRVMYAGWPLSFLQLEFWSTQSVQDSATGMIFL